MWYYSTPEQIHHKNSWESRNFKTGQENGLLQIQLLRIYDSFWLNNSGNRWLWLRNKQKEHPKNLKDTDFSPSARVTWEASARSRHSAPPRTHHLVGLIMIQALQGSLPWQSKKRKWRKQLCARERGLNHIFDAGSNWIKLRRWMREGLSKHTAQAIHSFGASPSLTSSSWTTQVLSECAPAPGPGTLKTKQKSPFLRWRPIST